MADPITQLRGQGSAPRPGDRLFYPAVGPQGDPAQRWYTPLESLNPHGVQVDGTTPKQLAPRSTTRGLLFVRNMHQAATLWYGDADVENNIAKGLPLLPSETLIFGRE